MTRSHRAAFAAVRAAAAHAAKATPVAKEVVEPPPPREAYENAGAQPTPAMAAPGVIIPEDGLPWLKVQNPATPVGPRAEATVDREEAPLPSAGPRRRNLPLVEVPAPRAAPAPEITKPVVTPAPEVRVEAPRAEPAAARPKPAEPAAARERPGAPPGAGRRAQPRLHQEFSPTPDPFVPTRETAEAFTQAAATRDELTRATGLQVIPARTSSKTVTAFDRFYHIDHAGHRVQIRSADAYAVFARAMARRGTPLPEVPATSGEDVKASGYVEFQARRATEAVLNRVSPVRAWQRHARGRDRDEWVRHEGCIEAAGPDWSALDLGALGVAPERTFLGLGHYGPVVVGVRDMRGRTLTVHGSSVNHSGYPILDLDELKEVCAFASERFRDGFGLRNELHVTPMLAFEGEGKLDYRTQRTNGFWALNLDDFPESLRTSERRLPAKTVEKMRPYALDPGFWTHR